MRFASQLAIAALALVATRASAAPLSAGERTAVAVVVLQPGGGDPELPARLVAAADEAWRADTGLVPVAAHDRGIDGAAIARCPPRKLLSCAIAALESNPIRVLAIASVLPISPQRAQLGSWIIDVDAAKAITAAARRSGQDESTLDNQLFRRSIVGPISELYLSDRGALVGYFAALRPELARTLDVAAPLGTIALDRSWSQAQVLLDERPIGVADRDGSVILDVRPGTRALRLIEIGGASHRFELDVRAGRLPRVGVPVASARPPPAVESWREWRSGLTVAGLALGAGGVALAALSGVAGGGVREGCLLRPGTDEGCGGLGSPTFAFDASAAPSTDPRAINPAAIAPLPLGLALATAGVSWAAGLALFGDEGDPPWLVAAAGVALGALAYGMVAVATAP